MPPMSCEATVATAAPATPMGMKTTRTISSTILMMDAMTRMTTGVRLSPMARWIPASIL